MVGHRSRSLRAVSRSKFLEAPAEKDEQQDQPGREKDVAEAGGQRDLHRHGTTENWGLPRNVDSP